MVTWKGTLKMKATKRKIGMMLVLCLILNTFFFTLYSEGVVWHVHAAQEKNGKIDDLEWTLDAKGVLTVSGNGNITKHQGKTGIPWLAYAKEITSAKLQITGMTDASYLLYGLTSLESVDTSRFNTSALTDMSYMFAGCTSLKEVTTNGWSTSRVTDMEGLFENCSGLVKLNTNFNTSNVTNMKRMFAGCTSLSTFDVKNFNVTNVRNMSEMFAGCNMKNIYLTSWKTPNLNYMNGMFKNCTNLTSIYLATFDTSRVVSMESLFENCRGLTSINLGRIDTSNVNNMKNMFYGCERLTELSVTGFDTSSVLNMSGMFAGCKGLTSLLLTNFDTHNVTDMSSMFENCFNLTSIEMANANVRRVETMTKMFYNCEKLRYIDMSKYDLAVCTKIDNMFTNCYALSTQITFAAKVSSSKECFKDAAVDTGAEIVVRYRDGCTLENAQAIVDTKSANSNIVLKKSPVNATIIYDGNGGTVTTKYKSYTMGEEVGKLSSDAVREGYKFVGWYDEKKGGNRYYSTTIGEGNITLYAHWVKVTVNAPKGMTLTSRYRRFVKVTWKAPSTGAGGYQIQIATSRQMGDQNITSATNFVKSYNTLISGQRYYFRMRAWIKDSTGKRVYSKWTAIKSIVVR